MSDLAFPDPGFEQLACDWVTIWQSELNGLAADREAAEQVHATVTAWVAVGTALRARERHAGATGAAGPDATARPAPPPAAPDAGGTVAALERRVAELERRLRASEPP